MITPTPLPPSYLKELPTHQPPPKFPFTQTRKSLRLFFEDLGDTSAAGGGGGGGGPVPSESVEGEGDVSYVYSVWAPMSVRIVQCVGMKSAVLGPLSAAPSSAPGAWGESADASGGGGAGVAGVAGVAGGEGGSGRGGGGGRMKVRAHPVVGWRGFEDIIGSIPGQTVDVIQSPSPSGPSQSSGLNSRASFAFFRLF